MNKQNINNGLRLSILIALGLVVTGCTSTAQSEFKSVTNQEKEAQLQKREDVLFQRENVLSQREVEIKRQVEALGDQHESQLRVEPLLPPKAQLGECYARVWIEPQYKQVQQKILVKEQTDKLEHKPAKYAIVEEKVLVSEASSKIVAIPAVYKTEKEKVLISNAQRTWRVKPDKSAALVSDGVLDRAKRHGIDLNNARANMCFHEHFIAADYETSKEKVLISEASESIVSIPAKYRTVEKKVMVKEASTRLVTVPAVYETVEDQVVDKPAHQVWKKGKGAIQKINESTGEIMCLVDVPATYKTVSKKVLKTPATTKTIDVPAKYNTISVRELVTPANEKRSVIPAKYTTVNKKKMVNDTTYVWHEITNKSLSKATRTGNQICLVEEPAIYDTVEKKVVIKPSTVNTVKIPEIYRDIKVQKVVSPAETKRVTVPAEYQTIQRSELVKEGYMEWRSILCETNMTDNRISDIQRALVKKGYNPGKIDGIVGPETMAAVNAFQHDNNLPVDEYLNIATIKALNVSTQ